MGDGRGRRVGNKPAMQEYGVTGQGDPLEGETMDYGMRRGAIGWVRERDIEQILKAMGLGGMVLPQDSRVR